MLEGGPGTAGWGNGGNRRSLGLSFPPGGAPHVLVALEQSSAVAFCSRIVAGPSASILRKAMLDVACFLEAGRCWTSHGEGSMHPLLVCFCFVHLLPFSTRSLFLWYPFSLSLSLFPFFPPCPSSPRMQASFWSPAVLGAVLLRSFFSSWIPTRCVLGQGDSPAEPLLSPLSRDWRRCTRRRGSADWWRDDAFCLLRVSSANTPISTRTPTVSSRGWIRGRGTFTAGA